MVLADLGRKLNAAFSSLSRAPVVDEKVCRMRMRITKLQARSLKVNWQVLDALLKEVCAALLESDVNVKLAAQLRQKVKAKAKAYFESGADRGKEANRKQVIQKVRLQPLFQSTGKLNSQPAQTIFDELVQLVDPGVEPYKPKKGHPNVIMAVGLQVRSFTWIAPSSTVKASAF